MSFPAGVRITATLPEHPAGPRSVARPWRRGMHEMGACHIHGRADADIWACFGGCARPLPTREPVSSVLSPDRPIQDGPCSSRTDSPTPVTPPRSCRLHVVYEAAIYIFFDSHAPIVQEFGYPSPSPAGGAVGAVPAVIERTVCAFDSKANRKKNQLYNLATL